MPVHSHQGVTLVGGGIVEKSDIAHALQRAPVLVAADGGANALLDWGLLPEKVIGDLDSLAPDLHASLNGRLEKIAEQDSTDFDKCLQRIEAPFILALGFDGARLDHTLAAMTSLVRHGSARVIIRAAEDICFLAPPSLAMTLRAGARVSLFPMRQVTGRSDGLHWPIDDLTFAPDRIIGTSNRARTDGVQLEIDAPGMLVLLEPDYLDEALRAVLAAPDWR